MQPQYIDDDSTPSSEADNFYQSNQSPYKPAAPGPPCSITNQSVQAHSLTSGLILNHSHLYPGKQGALLSHEQTLELYYTNTKKM
jgi:hypothetical protein